MIKAIVFGIAIGTLWNTGWLAYQMGKMNSKLDKLAKSQSTKQEKGE